MVGPKGTENTADRGAKIGIREAAELHLDRDVEWYPSADGEAHVLVLQHGGTSPEELRDFCAATGVKLDSLNIEADGKMNLRVWWYE